MTTQFIKHRFLIGVTFLLAGLVGCGQSGPERVSISGTVTFDGKEIGFGHISFVPTDGTKGSGMTGHIKNGQYRLDAKGGVPVGKYIVKINGFTLAPGQEPPGEIMGLDYHVGPQYLPEKYNNKSELSFTVDSGSSEITWMNYELKSS